MISAQYGTVFTHSEYDKIQKVYSICIQEDSNLLMYYDISLSRAQTQPMQMGIDLG